MYKQSSTLNQEIKFNGNLTKGVRYKGSLKDIKAVTQFMVDAIKVRRRLSRHELNDWQRARAMRYNLDNPKSYYLIQLYKDVMLDGHLTAVTENRTLRVINKDFIIVDKDGKKDPDKTKQIDNKKWFFDLLRYVHESIYYGYSAILISEVLEKANIDRVQIIDREHIEPHKWHLLKSINDDTGLALEDFPNEVLIASLYEGIGLLEKAAPYTILKRHSWASWDEFEELFGIPIRIAKVASNSDAVKNEVAEWLEEMGSAAYGVFPMGTEVEIKENSKADAFNVFFKKLESLDKEISKLILHQTMTTDNGSSRSQSEVHENTLGEVIKADEKNILSWLNRTLVPVLRYYGYDIPEGYEFDIMQVVDKAKKMEIDSKIMKGGYKFKKEYLEETYGVELEDVQEPKEPNDPTKEKKKDSKN